MPSALLGVSVLDRLARARSRKVISIVVPVGLLVYVHRFAEDPHQHQAPPAVARVDFGVFHEPESVIRAWISPSTTFDLEQHGPDVMSAVGVLDAVGARFVDHQHNVVDQCSRDVGVSQPVTEPMPDVSQFICGSSAFDSKGARWRR